MGGCSGDDGAEDGLELWAESRDDLFLGELGTPVVVLDTLPAPEGRGPAARREGDKPASKPNSRDAILNSGVFNI
jgi:hypothetical protein